MPKKIEKKISNNIINIQSIQTKDNIQLNNLDGYFIEKFNFWDIMNDKKLKQYIKNIESQFRNSDFYSSYISFLNNECNLDHCTFFGNIEKSDTVSIELHHYPFTLFDLTYILINNHVLNDIPMNSFTIINELIDIHASNYVGMTPLCLTAHQLVHDGKIFINLKSVYGNIQEFINIYDFKYKCIPDDLIEKYNKIVDASEKNILYSDENVLNTIDFYK